MFPKIKEANERIRKVGLSIDVDEFEDYYNFLGKTYNQDLTIWQNGVPQFLDLLEKHNVKATFFISGRHLDKPATRQKLKEIKAARHEIANHTYRHPVSLSSLSLEKVVDEIYSLHNSILSLTGLSMKGFRAPFFSLSPAVLESLYRLGYQYDSSVLPSSLILFSKFAASFLGGAEKFRNTSGHLKYIFYPRQIYPIIKRKDNILWELPISADPFFRFPLYSRYFLLLGLRFFKIIYGLFKKEEPLTIIFHAIELTDFDKCPIIKKDLSRLPEGRISFKNRLFLFDNIISFLRKENNITTLQSIANLNE